MKPAGIRYVALLAIFLMATAMAWTSLLEARGPKVSTSRLMRSARLFEQQGRVLNAVELYRRVLRAEPDHLQAATRLARMRAGAEALLRATLPKSTARVAKVTPVEAVKPLEPIAPDEPEPVREPVRESVRESVREPIREPVRESVGTRVAQGTRSIRTRIVSAVAKLKTERNQDDDGEASPGSPSKRGPQPRLVKTQKALAQAGDRIRSLRNSESSIPPKPKLPNSLPLKPQLFSSERPIRTVPQQEVEATPLQAQQPTPADPVTRVAKETPTVATAEPTSATDLQNSNPIVTRTRTAWARIREQFTAKPKPELEKDLQPAAMPMWQRLRNVLKRSRDNLALKLGHQPQASETVAIVEVPEESAVTSVTPDQAGSTVKPVETVAPTGRPEIPPVSRSEQIYMAGETLVARPDDASARAVLIEAVEVAPNVEASLAAYMLGTRGSGQPEVMSALGKQLSARTGIARVHMAEAMLRLDGNHVTATDSLVRMLSASDPAVRMMAAITMQSGTDTQRERFIPTLIKALKDTNSEVRAAAALALGGYGPAAKTALPALVRLVHDENVDTARAAAVALQCIAPPPATVQVDAEKITPVAAEANNGP